MNAKTSILLVENHEATRRGLMARLAEEEHFIVVGQCITKMAALSAALDRKPDVIICDIQLPDMESVATGIAEFRLICPESKLLIFSGEPSAVFANEMLVAGAAGYVRKSDPLSVLVETIYSLVRRPVGSTKLRSASRRIFTGPEREVLVMLAQGYKYVEIADRRGRSRETVRKQCDRLQIKLGLRCREHLITWAVSNGYAMLDSGTHFSPVRWVDYNQAAATGT